MIRISQSFSDHKLSFKFRKGTGSMTQEMEKFAVVVVRLPFRNIAWNETAARRI